MEQFFVPQDAAQNAPQGKNVKQQVKMPVEDFIALAKRLIAEYKKITCPIVLKRWWNEFLTQTKETEKSDHVNFGLWGTRSQPKAVTERDGMDEKRMTGNETAPIRAPFNSRHSTTV